jgi:hypothetical protein
MNRAPVRWQRCRNGWAIRVGDYVGLGPTLPSAMIDLVVSFLREFE